MSDKEWILNEFRKGRTLTCRDIYEERGCMRGPARIQELRKDGHNIVKTMEEGQRRDGERCRYARYSLRH